MCTQAPFSWILLFPNVSRKLFLTSFTALELRSLGVKDWRQCLSTWIVNTETIELPFERSLFSPKAKKKKSLSMKPLLLWGLGSLRNQSRGSHSGNWLLVPFISTWKHCLHLFIPKAELVLQASGEDSTCFIFQDSFRFPFENVFQALYLWRAGLGRKAYQEPLEIS